MYAGAVIVANMAFDYEVGKKTLDRFEPEMAANKPDARMVQWLNDFHSKNVELEEFIQIPRPPSLRFQKEWVLFKLYEKEQCFQSIAGNIPGSRQSCARAARDA